MDIERNKFTSNFYKHYSMTVLFIRYKYCCLSLVSISSNVSIYRLDICLRQVFIFEPFRLKLVNWSIEVNQDREKLVELLLWSERTRRARRTRRTRRTGKTRKTRRTRITRITRREPRPEQSGEPGEPEEPEEPGNQVNP